MASTSRLADGFHWRKATHPLIGSAIDVPLEYTPSSLNRFAWPLAAPVLCYHCNRDNFILRVPHERQENSSQFLYSPKQFVPATLVHYTATDVTRSSRRRLQFITGEAFFRRGGNFDTTTTRNCIEEPQTSRNNDEFLYLRHFASFSFYENPLTKQLWQSVSSGPQV
jgi:hypothetical protein